MTPRPEITFTRETWQHWLAQIHAFARAPDAGLMARTLFAVVILFALACNGLNVVNSYVGRNFMTALAERNHPAFVAQALVWVGVFAVATLCSVLGRYYEDRLSLVWRTGHYLSPAARALRDFVLQKNPAAAG